MRLWVKGNPLELEGFLFDMDGVVIDSERSWVCGTRRLLEEYGVTYRQSHDFKRELFGLTEIMRAKRFIARYGLPLTPEEFCLRRRNAVIAELKRVDVINGFFEFYEMIADTPKGLVTASSSEVVDNVFVGGRPIRSLFDIVVSVDGRKDDPLVWTAAAEVLRIPISKAVVFEDGIPGIKGALAAGATVVAFTTSFPDEVVSLADYFVRDYTELLFER